MYLFLVQCPDIILEDWYADRATVEITSLSPGGKATITCNPGYYLNSPPKYATTTCLSDGYWDVVDGLDCEKGIRMILNFINCFPHYYFF